MQGVYVRPHDPFAVRRRLVWSLAGTTGGFLSLFGVSYFLRGLGDLAYSFNRPVAGLAIAGVGALVLAGAWWWMDGYRWPSVLGAAALVAMDVGFGLTVVMHGEAPVFAWIGLASWVVLTLPGIFAAFVVPSTRVRARPVRTGMEAQLEARRRSTRLRR